MIDWWQTAVGESVIGWWHADLGPSEFAKRKERNRGFWGFTVWVSATIFSFLICQNSQNLGANFKV